MELGNPSNQVARNGKECSQSVEAVVALSCLVAVVLLHVVAVKE